MVNDKRLDFVLEGFQIRLQDVRRDMIFVVHLFGIKIVFKHTVIKINGGQLLQLLGKLASDIIDDILQELFHQLKIIYEDLQQVFYSYLLVWFQSKLVFVLIEALTVFGIINKCHCNFFDYFEYFLLLNLFFINCSSNFLALHFLGWVMFLLQKFRHVLLKTLNFLFQIVDIFINNFQSCFIIMSIFNFDLYQQVIVSIRLGQSFCLVQCLLLLPANFNSSVYIEDRILLAISFLFVVLDQPLYFIFLLHLDIAIQ